MTKEELQKWLKNLKSDIGNSQHHELWHYEQAIDIVIEALSDKDINVPSNDCISRQAEIDAMGRAKWAIDRIKELPSAQPEIVRCKDCRFYQVFEEYNQSGCALAVSRFVYKPNDFCSRAERRTNGTD